MFGSLKATVLLVVLLLVLLPLGLETVTSRPSFCGSCHIMNRYYNSWQNSKHNQVACVDCHYAPGEQHSLTAKFRGLSQLFSYLGTGGNGGVRNRARISDLSCTSSNCHSLQGDFPLKRVAFSEKINYVHKTHFDKNIEGQKLHCNTCHIHQTQGKHFEVPKEACYLCHFKNTEFNKGRSECVLCHEITDRPLQKQFEEGREEGIKPITHKTLADAGVACTACHVGVVRGTGKVKTEACVGCHDEGTQFLEKAGDKKAMHQAHVASTNADCFNCHEPIQHGEVKDYLEAVRSDCQSCHPDHHKFQKALLVGVELEDVSETPALMHAVKTNCIGCHTRKDLDGHGQTVMKGSPGACASCHTEEYEKMVNTWAAQVTAELTRALEAETKAAGAVERAAGKIPEEDMQEAGKLLETGRNYLDTVRYGNGVHNQKYSVSLIDSAVENFNTIVDGLKDVEEPKKK